MIYQTNFHEDDWRMTHINFIRLRQIRFKRFLLNGVKKSWPYNFGKRCFPDNRAKCGYITTPKSLLVEEAIDYKWGDND